MDSITRAEHEEFERRLTAEDKRLGRRLNLLEEELKNVRDLTASVEKLAVNMENMMKMQEKQGLRLEKLESRDGDMWRKAVWLTISTVLGALIGFLLSRFGL